MEHTNAVEALGALAQEHRLAVYRLLVKRGPDGFTPSELVQQLEIPSPTLSFHLKELQRVGLVLVRRDGRFLYYTANFPQMRCLVDYLTENCCGLAEENCCEPLAKPPKARSRSKSKRHEA